MRELFRRIGYLVNRRRLERELAEEMAAHREEADAEGHANPAFGSPMRQIETAREVWGWTWLDRLFQDLRYGLRLLRKSPGFTLTAVLVLALGIGVNLTGFRLLLIATTPAVRDPDTLVEIDRWFPNGRGNTIAYPVLAFYAEHAHSFQAVIGSAGGRVAFGDAAPGSDPEYATVDFVNAAWFTEQGPPAMRGRVLTVSDEAPGAEPVVVLSEHFWQRRLGAPQDVVGKTVRLSGKLVHVAGVLHDARGPRYDLWMPLAQEPYIDEGSTMLTDWNTPTQSATARLKPGVSVQAAEAECRALAAVLHESHPEGVQKDERLSLTQFSSNRMHPQEVVAVSMAVVLVMLILVVACANLGSLQLARGVAREREIRTRLALGASRWRVVRQLLTESTLLAAAGSLAAWFLSAFALQVFLTVADQPPDWSLAMDWRVMAGTVAIALVAAMVFGLAPAFRLTGSAPHGGRARSVFLAAQVGASCILLMVSGQLVRSFAELLKTDPGFDYSKMLTISPGLHAHGYDNAAAKQYFDKLLPRIAAIPGVEAASVTWLPVWGNVVSGFIDQGRRVGINRVDGDFARTVGLRITRGRRFEANERGVAIVSESFARWHWPGENPIGKQVTLRRDATGIEPATVVGVAAKAGTFDIQDPEWMGVYYPIHAEDYRDASIVVRVARDPGKVAGPLIAIAGAQDRKLRSGYTLLRTAHDGAVAQSRTMTSVLSGLGFLATLLAAIGLAGLTGYTVSQRTREIGIRIALGAARPRVVRAVLRPLVVPVASGIAAGMLVAGGISSVLRNQLSGLRPADPWAYLMAILLFGAVVALAVTAPARRAVRIQPAQALRHE